MQEDISKCGSTVKETNDILLQIKLTLE